MSKIKVLLADDHRIVAEGLRRLLEPTYELVAIVENGRELIAAAKELEPEVIVADISMPLLNGIDAATQIRNAGIRAKIVFLTMHAEANYARRALAAGASAYVLKHSASSELHVAIQRALAGRYYVTPTVAAKIDRTRTPEDVSLDALDGLTVRQREVLQLLAEGYSAKQVSTFLKISRRTVEYHKYHIMEILDFHKSAELIQFAVERGLVLQSLTPHSCRQRPKNQ
jgi:DNA-binding NarL/FixJ family response regulator